MLTYNDQLIREAQNEKVCRQLLSVSKQDQAIKAAQGVAPKIRRTAIGRDFKFSPAVTRIAYAALITLLTIVLATQVAIAAYDLLNSGGGGVGALMR